MYTDTRKSVHSLSIFVSYPVSSNATHAILKQLGSYRYSSSTICYFLKNLLIVLSCLHRNSLVKTSVLSNCLHSPSTTSQVVGCKCWLPNSTTASNINNFISSVSSSTAPTFTYSNHARINYSCSVIKRGYYCIPIIMRNRYFQLYLCFAILGPMLVFRGLQTQSYDT